MVSAFSKILGGKPQGLAMGWIGSAGSLGRIVSPPIKAWLMHYNIVGIDFLLYACLAVGGALATLGYNSSVQAWRKGESFSRQSAESGSI